jgi:F0F1-type ATP synthase assembly protein I
LNRQDDGGRRSEGRSPLWFVGIGFELVAPLLAGLLVGRWLDGRFETRPWLVLGGAVVGAVVGMWSFVRRVVPPTGAGRGGSA